MTELLADALSELGRYSSGFHPIYHHCYRKNHDKVIELLESEDIDINNNAGPRDCCLVHIAAHNKDPLMFEILIEHGAYDNAIWFNMYSERPIHIASRNNCFEIVQLIIERRPLSVRYPCFTATNNTMEHRYPTPVLIAINSKNRVIYNLLAKANGLSDSKTDELREATIKCLPDICRDLVSRGANPGCLNREYRSSVIPGSSLFLQALYKICCKLKYSTEESRERCIQMMRFIASNSPHTECLYGEFAKMRMSPFTTACWNSRFELCDVLLENGGGNAFADTKWTRLYYRLYTGTTLQIICQIYGHVDYLPSTDIVTIYESVKYLISKGVNINRQDLDGNTALHHIADDLIGNAQQQAERNRVAELLLEHGADKSIKNTKGKMPEEICMRKPMQALFEKWNIPVNYRRRRDLFLLYVDDSR